VTLLDVVAEAVRGQHGMPVNIAGLVAAVCLDLGFTPEQLAPLLTLLGCHMIVANAHEGALLRSEVLRRLPDAAIRYVGRPPRVSPQAAAHVPKQRL